MEFKRPQGPGVPGLSEDLPLFSGNRARTESSKESVHRTAHQHRQPVTTPDSMPGVAKAPFKRSGQMK